MHMYLSKYFFNIIYYPFDIIYSLNPERMYLCTMFRSKIKAGAAIFDFKKKKLYSATLIISIRMRLTRSFFH